MPTRWFLECNVNSPNQLGVIYVIVILDISPSHNRCEQSN